MVQEEGAWQCRGRNLGVNLTLWLPQIQRFPHGGGGTGMAVCVETQQGGEKPFCKPPF